MEQKVIIIERDGSSYTCESLDKAALLTGNHKTQILYHIDNGTADSKGRTYDFAQY